MKKFFLVLFLTVAIVATATPTNAQETMEQVSIRAYWYVMNRGGFEEFKSGWCETMVRVVSEGIKYKNKGMSLEEANTEAIKKRVAHGRLKKNLVKYTAAWESRKRVERSVNLALSFSYKEEGNRAMVLARARVACLQGDLLPEGPTKIIDAARHGEQLLSGNKTVSAEQ